MATDLERVIPDARLRDAVVAHSAASVSVLIEVSRQGDRVTLRDGRPRSVALAPPDNAAVEAVRALLRDKAGAEPTWLGSAGAFAADCTGADLADLAARPEVRRITPNRQLPPPSRSEPG